MPFGESRSFCHSCRYERNSLFSRILFEKGNDTSFATFPLGSALQTVEGKQKNIFAAVTKCRSCSSIWLASMSIPSSPNCKGLPGLQDKNNTKFLANHCSLSFRCLLLVKGRALLEVEALRLDHLCSFHTVFKHSTVPLYNLSFGRCCYFSSY